MRLRTRASLVALLALPLSIPSLPSSALAQEGGGGAPAPPYRPMRPAPRPPEEQVEEAKPRPEPPPPARAPTAPSQPEAPGGEGGAGAPADGTTPPTGEAGGETPAEAPVDEDAIDEAALEAELEGENPARPPSKGKGVVWGVVRSSNSKDTLIEAQINVAGLTKRALSDIDGRYRLELPPGTYQLRVAYELHKPKRLVNVVVKLGEVVRLDVDLEPDERGVEELSAVEADVERGTTATQFMLRKNSAAASDSIGAQDIAKTPDRNAADSVRRVVGATVVDGRYVFIRGLGERYTNALLNGVPIPSPEPDRQAVPLDLFPALIISDITVAKTLTPDRPADFAGGSVDIHTRDLPPQFQLQLSGTLGYNSESTFLNRLSYRGGGTDWLGFDDGTRRLSPIIPARRVNRIRPDGSIEPRLTEYGRALVDDMTTRRTFNLPNGSLNIVLGNSHHFGKNKAQVLAYQLAATYSRRFQRRYNERLRTMAYDEEQPFNLRRLNDYTAESGFDQVAWSSLGTVSYAPSNEHKISMMGIYSVSASNEARSIFGFAEDRGSDISDVRLRFISRQLAFGQLRGEHRFPKWTKGQLNWSAFGSDARMDEPNTRQTVYSVFPDRISFVEFTQSGAHFFAKQNERGIGGTLDWLQPLAEGKVPTSLKLGSLVNLRDRNFNSRRFQFQRASRQASAYEQPASTLFRPENVGEVLELNEWTRPNDAYKAGYDVYAAYIMGDIGIARWLRLVIGERVEAATQTIDSFDPFAPRLSRVTNRLQRTDLLPTANVIVKATENTNIRLGASQTVARPQLRELAPFLFTEYYGARDILGNPELDRTKVSNVDARYEWFPGMTEVLAVTAFYKYFQRPIEQVIIPTNAGVITYENSPSARNFGLELEARKGLGFVSPTIREFSLIGNLTLVDSLVRVRGGENRAQTSDERPLAGQSPYVVNAAIDYTHEPDRFTVRALYNVFGPRIAQVGQNDLPDVYEQPRHTVDLTASRGFGRHIDVKASVENLFNSPVRFSHGREGFQEAIVQRYYLGTNVWLSLSYTH
jgi:hypothetical protein